AAVSSICSSTSRGSPSMVRRCCSEPSPLSCGFRIRESQCKRAALVAQQTQEFSLWDRKRRAHVLREDGQLALAAVDQRRNLDLAGPSVVEQLVHRGAHRAPCKEPVVDQDNVPLVYVERNLGRFHLPMQANGIEVVAIEGDVERAQRRRQSQLAMQALGEP